MMKYIIMGKSLAKKKGQEDNNKTLIVNESARVAQRLIKDDEVL